MPTRREVLFAAPSVVALALEACGSETPIEEAESKEKNIPEIVIEDNYTVYRFDNVRDYLTADIGVDNLMWYADPVKDLIFFFSELSPKAEPIPLGNRKADPSLESTFGLVPFDDKFDVNSSLNILSQTIKGQPIPIEEASVAVNRFRQYSDKQGYLTSYPTPEAGMESMLVFGPNLIYMPKNDVRALADPAIFKAKIIVSPALKRS